MDFNVVKINLYMVRAMQDRMRWLVVEYVYKLVHPPQCSWLYSSTGEI